MAFTVTVQPWIPAITYAMAQDMITYGNNQAQDLWSDIQGQVIFPETSGGTALTAPDGERVPVHELFGAPSQDTSYSNMSNLSDGEFVQRGIDDRIRLSESPDSSEGQAYRVLRDTSTLSKPDLTDDPLWGSTDAVFDFLNGIPVDCTGDDTHTPDYRTCERVNISSTACQVPHDYDIGIFEHVDGPINMSSCGEGCMDFWVGKIGDDYYSGHCKIFEEAMTIKMLNPDAILSAKIVHAVWDDYMQIWVGDTKAWSGPNNNFPPETAGACELDTSWNRNPNKDVTHLFANRERGEIIDMKVRVSVTGGGEGYAKIRVYYDPNKVVNFDEWQNPSCIQNARIYNAKYGSTGATCTRMPALTPAGCLSKNGVTVCPSSFETPPIPGISPFCEQVDVKPPAQLTASNTCAAFEENPKCGFITSECNGMTLNEYIQDLYRFGIGRVPNAAEMNHWIGVFHDRGQDYEILRSLFFTSAGFHDEEVINSFTCSTFVETYDCGFEHTANSGACAVQDLFQADFADCVEEMVPVEIEREIETTQLFVCQDALELTECTVERELSTMARSGNGYWTRDCFIEEEVTYRIPWANDAITANATITTSGNHTSASIMQQPSALNDWTAKIKLIGSGEMVTKTRQIQVDCEQNELEPDPVTGLCHKDEDYEVLECPPDSRLSVNLKAEGHSVSLNQEEYPEEEGNAPCLRESDDWTTTTWECEEHSPLNLGGVGFTLAALTGAIEPMYPGAPATCVKGHATYDTMPYGEGELCWTAHDGVEHCEEIDTPKTVSPGADNCAPYREKEEAGECRYDGRFAVQDGDGSTGFHYVWEHRYTCTTDTTTVTKTELEPKYVCSGIVRCMGDECMTPNRETSDGFGKAAAMLQAVQEIGEDVTCDVSETGNMMECQVFAGEAQTCMQALGSYVDCCESPGGVSLGDYVTAAKGAMKLDAYLTSGNTAEAIQSGYTAIRDPVAAPIKYVTDAFTSVADNVTAKVMGKEAAGKGAEGALKETIGAAKQKLMEGANYVLQETLGPEVAEMVFQESAGELVLNEAFGMVLGIIGLIYTIYTVAKLLISIIWTCTEDELGLAVDVDLKKTRYIGSYCAKKSVFGCTETRQSYCVFSSPLARIINEQSRPQLGRGWGTPKEPDCSGITISELQRLDWSQLDLGEWMDILDITGNMPGSGGLDLEAMTGSGSYLGQLASDAGDNRMNTAERNQERLDGVDLGELNQRAADEMWRDFKEY